MLISIHTLTLNVEHKDHEVPINKVKYKLSKIIINLKLFGVKRYPWNHVEIIKYCSGVS